MNQVSRPMQITLVATLVFVAAWFLVLKPKGATDVAATPVTAPAVTAAAASTPGKTNSALDKTAYAQVGKAKVAAAAATADAQKSESQTADSSSSSAAKASTPDAASSTKSKADIAAIAARRAAAQAGGTASASTAVTAAKPATATKSTSAVAATTPKLSHADRVILKIQKDLAARKAVVVLVWSKTGAEDRTLYKLIKNKIDLRGGKVKTFFIPVNQVGRYDGLLAGLSLGQTPSTIVIAPNNEAKVLGGLTSAARIDRLTSSAVLTKPAAATK